MSNIKNNENIEMCTMCGGMCCLKSSCDYSGKKDMILGIQEYKINKNTKKCLTNK